MEPRIEILAEKKLIGKRMRMTLANNKTFDLWHSFMPRRKEIENNVGTDLYSMQVYDADKNFNDFNFTTEFEKWAAIEVTDFDSVPEGIESYTLPGGLYAVFIYKGLPENFGPTFQYIFKEWLPASIYEVDNRPHFEILGAKYNRLSPDSEEEIWVPVKKKNANL